MNNRRAVKWMLAAMLMVLPLILTGCYVTPDIQTGNVGNTGIGDFPTFPPATSQPAAPTSNPVYSVTDAPTGGITTPAGNAGVIILPTNNEGNTGWNPIVMPTVPITNSITITTPPFTPAPTATPAGALKLGSQGEAVREIQRKLKTLGFYNGQADGDFGPGTEEAVKAFQEQYKLTPDGVVGSGTLTKLASASATKRPDVTPTPVGSLKLGASGDDVREVQRRLKSLGFYNGSVDGDYGEGTEAAVKAFQKQYGLTADGKAGAQTLEKLRNARATAKPVNKPGTPVPSFNENTYLRKGNSSSDVRKMQERLIDLGYLSGKATGTFDSATEAAVTAFQKRNCSYSDGVAGPLTLKALYSSSAKGTSSPAGVIGTTLQEGSEGADVRSLQTKLKSLGYYTGTVDGSYGEGTKNAVKAFQKANGLTADGKAGAATLNLLYSGKAKTASQARVTNTPRPTATRKPTATPYRTATPLPAGTWVKVTKAPNTKYVTLRQGNYGSLVEDLQQELKDQGFYTGVVDGYYGNGTVEAVKSFQRRYGLNVDGAAGPATQRYLYEGSIPDGA